MAGVDCRGCRHSGTATVGLGCSVSDGARAGQVVSGRREGSGARQREMEGCDGNAAVGGQGSRAGRGGDAGGAGVRRGFRYAVRIRDKRPSGGAAQRWL